MTHHCDLRLFRITLACCCLLNISCSIKYAVAFEPSPPQTQGSRILTPKHVQDFKRDGYVLLRGVLSKEEVSDLTKAGDAAVELSPKTPMVFSVIERGAIFTIGSGNKEDGKSVSESGTSNQAIMDRQQVTATFRNVALRSKLPQICAELMELDPQSQNLRILRDVFLAKPVNYDKVCDWHVDDQGFWPESFICSAPEGTDKDQNGINAWIALDDIPAEFEGSMAVAPGSHTADWRHEGYKMIGQDRTKPGPSTDIEFIKMLSQTCAMDVATPAFREQIEKTKVILDIRRGDVVLATRLLFHRTLAVNEKGKEHYAKIGKTSLNRYSVRYVLGTARLPRVAVYERSLLQNEENVGRSLDEVVEKSNELWYPKVWPQPMETDIDVKLDYIGNNIIPALNEKEKAFFAKFAALRQQAQINNEKAKSGY